MKTIALTLSALIVATTAYAAPVSQSADEPATYILFDQDER